MIKLALVGKDIQHSRSPEIYKSILGSEVQYDLLDFQKTSTIPTAKDLLAQYLGVSITGPYKRHFLAEVNLTSAAQSVGAINCLGLKNGKITGENTDYFAIVDILQEAIQEYKQLNIVILGDGVMSVVTQQVLRQLGITNFKVYSRKLTDNFDQLNMVDIFFRQFPTSGQKIIINTCSRDFVFNGLIDKKTLFWDYNYNFESHFLTLSSTAQAYIDGSKMLELQARYALAFWSIKNA